MTRASRRMSRRAVNTIRPRHRRPGPDPARRAGLDRAAHGQATLRMDRPQFPWPPLKPMIAKLVTHLVGLPAHTGHSHAENGGAER